jgi:hypothetical protein
VEGLEEYLLCDTKKEDIKIKGVIYDFDLIDVKCGNYLYDKVTDNICCVFGWEHTEKGDCLVLRYETDNYNKLEHLAVGTIKEFNKKFYFTVSQEPNAAGYVKESIQKHLGLHGE